jgi:uncharacterized membrane protein
MFLASITTTAGAAETFYRLVDIGTVPWDSTNGARGIAMNSKGDIVGVSLETPIRAFFWDAKTGAMTELVAFSGGTDDFVYAGAVNDHGAVVGESIKGVSEPNHALLWEPRSYQAIELEPPGGCRFASAEAINDRGAVALYTCGGGLAHAHVRKPDGTLVDLGVLPGDDSAFQWTSITAGKSWETASPRIVA